MKNHPILYISVSSFAEFSALKAYLMHSGIGITSYMVDPDVKLGDYTISFVFNVNKSEDVHVILDDPSIPYDIFPLCSDIEKRRYRFDQMPCFVEEIQKSTHAVSFAKLEINDYFTRGDDNINIYYKHGDREFICINTSNKTINYYVIYDFSEKVYKKIDKNKINFSINP